jgi:glycosyltransferase involved in cell wall biosynthesis
MKTVSVVIPAKNEEAYIANCLASLAALHFPAERYEVIVADNGSTDQTVSIAESWAVKVANLPEKKSISAVRNGGALQASGDILVFLDADCTVAPDWLLQAERYFDRNDVACFGSSPIIPEKATWVEQTWFLVRESHRQVFEREWQESTNMFIPKAVFEKAGGFNEKLKTCEDVDLSYRLAKFGKIIADKRIVAVHHRDPKSIREFFFKEKWRGKNNYSGFFQHGIKVSELPSLLLPLYYTAMLLAAFGAAALGAFLWAGVVFFAGHLPVFMLVFIKTRHNFNMLSYGRLLVLYNVYFLARTCAIF